MSLVAGLFVALFIRLPTLASGRSTSRQRCFGASLAAVRATLASGLSLLARQLGRRQDDVRNGLNSLLLVAAEKALFIPNLPRDAGFSSP